MTTCTAKYALMDRDGDVINFFDSKEEARGAQLELRRGTPSVSPEKQTVSQRPVRGTYIKDWNTDETLQFPGDKIDA